MENWIKRRNEERTCFTLLTSKFIKYGKSMQNNYIWQLETKIESTTISNHMHIVPIKLVWLKIQVLFWRKSSFKWHWSQFRFQSSFIEQPESRVNRMPVVPNVRRIFQFCTGRLSSGRRLCGHFVIFSVLCNTKTMMNYE